MRHLWGGTAVISPKGSEFDSSCRTFFSKEPVTPSRILFLIAKNRLFDKRLGLIIETAPQNEQYLFSGNTETKRFFAMFYGNCAKVLAFPEAEDSLQFENKCK